MNILNKIYIEERDLLTSLIKKDAVIVTSSERKKTNVFNEILSGCFNIEINSEPDIEIIDTLYYQLKKRKVDTIVAFGGGSVIDSAKILSVSLKNKKIPSNLLNNFDFDKRLNLIVIPTTFGSGSEATSIGVFKKNKKKQSVKNDLMIPDSIFLFEKSFEGSHEMSKLFVADAFCHAIESFYSKNSNEISRILSATSLKMICNNSSFKNKINLAFASLLAGIAENSVGVCAIHAIAYPLQNKLKLSHAFSNSIVLGFCENGSLFGDKKYLQLERYGLNDEMIKKSVKKLSSKLKVKNDCRIDAIDYADDCLTYEKLLSNCRIKISRDFLINFYEKIEQNKR